MRLKKLASAIVNGGVRHTLNLWTSIAVEPRYPPSKGAPPGYVGVAVPRLGVLYVVAGGGDVPVVQHRIYELLETDLDLTTISRQEGQGSGQPSPGRGAADRDPGGQRLSINGTRRMLNNDDCPWPVAQ